MSTATSETAFTSTKDNLESQKREEKVNHKKSLEERREELNIKNKL